MAALKVGGVAIVQGFSRLTALIDGEIDGATDVVEARHAHSAAGEVTVVQGPHLLDAEVLCGGIELAGELVHDRE